MAMQKRQFHLWSIARSVVVAAVVGTVGYAARAADPAASQPTTQPTTQAARPRPASPVVSADGSVTFRVYQPDAKLVEVWGDWPKPEGMPMTRDAGGVWTVTFAAIPKGVWAYSFKTDGRYDTDHANPAWKPSREVTSSVLDLPGGGAWDRQPGVPHGVVRLYDYDSDTLHRARRLRVYTPPGYDADSAGTYPVLYLLHGSGDNESTWTEFGRANVILDNLIAAKQAVPMIVVMTDGHAVGGGAPNERSKNVDAFSAELLGQVMPMIEKEFRVRRDAASHAIAGLSMGGNQAIIVGLHHPELFAYVGGMSSAIRDPERDLGDALQPAADAGHRTFRLVWLSCGTDDFLLGANRHFHDVLGRWQLPHEYHETPGKHAWPVWRNNLITLLPRLFREP